MDVFVAQQHGNIRVLSQPISHMLIKGSACCAAPTVFSQGPAFTHRTSLSRQPDEYLPSATEHNYSIS